MWKALEEGKNHLILYSEARKGDGERNRETGIEDSEILRSKRDIKREEKREIEGEREKRREEDVPLKRIREIQG